MMNHIIKLAQSNLISWLIVLVAIVPPIYHLSWSITRNTDKVADVTTEVAIEMKDGWLKIVDQTEIIQKSVTDLTASIKSLFKIKDEMGDTIIEDGSILEINPDLWRMDPPPASDIVKDATCSDGFCPAPSTAQPRQYQTYQRQPLFPIFRRY